MATATRATITIAPMVPRIKRRRRQEATARLLESDGLWSAMLVVSIVGLLGTLVWFVWYGVSWYWALLVVVLLLIGATGVARLVSEGGILLVKGPNPSVLLHSVFTPADLGEVLLAGAFGNFIRRSSACRKTCATANATTRRCHRRGSWSERMKTTRPG